MSALQLPIVNQWKESFGQLKDDGRQVTVQGGAWVIRDALVHDAQELIVVLDVGNTRYLVSYDSIAGIAFEHVEQDDTTDDELVNEKAHLGLNAP